MRLEEHESTIQIEYSISISYYILVPVCKLAFADVRLHLDIKMHNGEDAIIFFFSGFNTPLQLLFTFGSRKDFLRLGSAMPAAWSAG